MNKTFELLAVVIKISELADKTSELTAKPPAESRLVPEQIKFYIFSIQMITIQHWTTKLL